MFDAVIFDWDGTLADTKEAVLASFHGALQEVLDLDVADEFIERRIGVGAAWTFREIIQAKGLSVDEKVIEKLVKVKIEIALEMANKVKLFPGAKELLESLDCRVKIGLASMNNRQIIDQLVRSLEVEEYFEAVITVDEVNKSKPDPEIFLKAAAKLKTAPERCVVVEDSIFGVKAAKAGQMACIAVTQGAYSDIELAKENPDLIVSSIKERDSILRLVLV